jgi:hypothetical protein
LHESAYEFQNAIECPTLAKKQEGTFGALAEKTAEALPSTMPLKVKSPL